VIVLLPFSLCVFVVVVLVIIVKKLVTLHSIYAANRRNQRTRVSLVLRIELCSLQTYRNLFLSSRSSCVLICDRGGVCILIYKNRSTGRAPVP
jgi:hypothetical protein